MWHNSGIWIFSCWDMNIIRNTSYTYKIIWSWRVQGHFAFIWWLFSKMSCNSKTARHRAKLSEIWDSWMLVTYTWGTYDLVVFNVILGSFGARSKTACIRPGRRAKQLNLGITNTSYTYPVYKVIWPCRGQGKFGVIQCTCLKMTYISKRTGLRAKQSEIWDSWTLVAHMWGTFDLVGFKVIWGHMVHLSQNGLYVEKWWS